MALIWSFIKGFINMHVRMGKILSYQSSAKKKYEVYRTISEKLIIRLKMGFPMKDRSIK